MSDSTQGYRRSFSNLDIDVTAINDVTGKGLSDFIFTAKEFQTRNQNDI